MAAFFSTQLDFIFFFYGLAFILLGSVCLGIARGGRREIPWLVLGAFAFIHGAVEWLDLLALVVGDTTPFAIFRIGIMTVSFMALLEFARLEGARLGLNSPGRWIHAALLLLVAFGAYEGGLNGANAVARYSFGLGGAAGTAFILATHATRAAADKRWWLVSAAFGFALYGFAAGVVVPQTPQWAGDLINYGDFIQFTGLPVQFVRGVLACWMALSIWGYWVKTLTSDVASARYSKFMKRQFVLTLVAMGGILALGWVLTEYLGGIYKQNVQHQAEGDIDLIGSRLAGDTAAVNGMTRALAGSHSIRSLVDGDGSYGARVDAALRLHAEASGSRQGYILDRTGAVVTAYDRGGRDRSATANFANASYFRSAIAGEFGYAFAVREFGKQRDYFASAPVRDEAGDVVGAVVLVKSLDRFDADLRHFETRFYLIDAQGIAIVTNQPNYRFRTLWPRTPGLDMATTQNYGPVNETPLLNKEILTAAWTTIDGARNYVQRRAIAETSWSIVTASAPKGIFASRVLGIIITLQMTTLALVFLVGRERWVHDTVQLQKRADLEELARNLDYRATTDPLTGLYNRRKFDRELSNELMRAQRYGTPLSMILFDVDHFKAINDTHGHLVGDNVLSELSGFVSGQIRASDVLARWGGEEFMLLTPGLTADQACQFAFNLGAAIRGHNMNVQGHISCSFGVTEVGPEDTADTLIRRVDEALYKAKVNGRDRVELAERPGVMAPGLVPLG